MQFNLNVNEGECKQASNELTESQKEKRRRGGKRKRKREREREKRRESQESLPVWPDP